MDLLKRINTIIQYPKGYQGLDTAIWNRPEFDSLSEKFLAGTESDGVYGVLGFINDPLVNSWLRGEFSNFNDYLYAKPASSQTNAYTSNLSYAKLWESSAEIAPLEGYSLCYWNNRGMCNFSSLLNTSEFANQLYADLSGSDFTKTYFLFLNALPINPTYPISTPQDSDTSMPTRATFDENPSAMFKSSAGIYSVPVGYINWLGGQWQFREITNEPFTSSFVQVVGDTQNGFTDVVYTIDPNRYNNQFFRKKEYEDSYSTIEVDIDYFKKKDPTNGVTATSVIYHQEGSSIDIRAVDDLRGLGTYQDLFGLLYQNWYGVALPVDNIVKLNLNTPLRTFQTYSYDISSDHTLKSYATYSVLQYTAKLMTTSDLPLASATTNNQANPFNLYQAVWNYLYYRMTNGSDYETAASEVVNRYGSSSADLDAIMQATDLMFTSVTSESERATPIADFTIDNKKNGLYVQDGFRSFVDYIGNEVLRYVQQPQVTITPAEIATYRLNNDYGSIVLALYPSAGGTAGLQYSVGHLPKGLAPTNPTKSQINRVTQQFLTFVSNACRMVWFSGPFLGDSNYRSNLVSVANGGLGFNNTKLVLHNLHKQTLFNKAEFTNPFNVPVTANNPNFCADIPKDSRTYILDADFGKREYVVDRNIFAAASDQTYDPVMYYDDMIDYVGLGLMELFNANFLSTANGDGKNLLLSLLVVDENDFLPLSIDIVDSNNKTTQLKFTVQEQINLLLLYNGFHAFSYQNGAVWQTTPAPDLLKVMNASLTQAQFNKAVRVIGEYMKERKLVNSGSVFDYLSVLDAVNNGVVENQVDSALLRQLDTTSDGAYIRDWLFGNQATVQKWGGGNALMHEVYLKYLGRNVNPANVVSYSNRLNFIVNYFFSDKGIDVQPTVPTIKIAKDILLYYISLFDGVTPNNTIAAENLTTLRNQIAGWMDVADKDTTACLTAAGTALSKLQSDNTNQIRQKAQEQPINTNVLKTKTYYNVKALYDNWMQVDDYDTAKVHIGYTQYNVDSPPREDISLAEHFMFTDRAMRDIGDVILVDINWLTDFLKNNIGSANTESTNKSLYTFISELASHHSMVIHPLPAYISMDTFSDATKSAVDMFGTFDYVNVMETSPKFILQYLGSTSSVLNTAQNKAINSFAKSYSLLGDKPVNQQRSNTANIKDNTSVPKDVQGGEGLAFVVNFGAQEQQIFSNLILDQSEFQNTEEYYKLITSFATDKSQTQSGNLFAVFTERSYTATVDSLGNLMIQPLMFFELVNIPMFAGTYWITNVKHQITPNDIKTTFKGVRQPMSVLPSKTDVLLQLAEMNLKNLTNVLGTAPIPEGGGGGGGGGGTTPAANYDPNLTNKLNGLSSTQVSILNETEIQNNLFNHLQTHSYVDNNMNFNVFKAFLQIESNGDTTAANPGGATGIIQLMPSTGRGVFDAIRSQSWLKNQAISLDNLKSTNGKDIDDMTTFTKDEFQSYMKGLDINQQIFVAKVYYWKNYGLSGGSWSAGKLQSPLTDIYQFYGMLFAPAYINHFNDDNFVLYSKAKGEVKAVEGNYPYSDNPTNPKLATVITVGTFKNAVSRIVKKHFHIV